MRGVTGEGASTVTEKLDTITSDEPQQIRNQLVRTVREAVPSNLALFVKLTENRDGVRFFTDDAMDGDADAITWLRPFVDQPVLECPWFPENGDPDVLNNFRRPVTRHGERTIAAYEVTQVAFVPIEGETQLRSVLSNGTRLLGWLRLVRRGRKRRFLLEEEQRMQRAIGSTKAILAAAEAFEARVLDRELFAVARPDGDLEHTSSAFGEWLDDDRTEYLARRIQAVDRGAPRAGVEVIAGAEVRVVRLDGALGVRYVVTVDRAELLRFRPEEWLTPRQREVASVAVAGASNAEIASILGVSDETVKSHLTEIYRRLRVDNRTELATLLPHLAE